MPAPPLESLPAMVKVLMIFDKANVPFLYMDSVESGSDPQLLNSTIL